MQWETATQQNVRNRSTFVCDVKKLLECSNQCCAAVNVHITPHWVQVQWARVTSIWVL